MSPETAAKKTAGPNRPQEPVLNCPRCDSPNTKFCYYNNYSLTQPRHFCKTCRRYWTKGGALRNVPIGGASRKNKRIKSSPRLSSNPDYPNSVWPGEGGGLKFFQGLSPAMDFQITKTTTTPTTGILMNQFPPGNPNCFSLDPLPGFTFEDPPGSRNDNNFHRSSIESLSSINQDLHWKLQQQRLAMLVVGDQNHKENNPLVQSAVPAQPIPFQNLELSKQTEAFPISRKDNGKLSTEWFLDNSYASMDPTPATSSSNNNNHNNNGMNEISSSSNWSGMQGWTELTQYSSLP